MKGKGIYQTDTGLHVDCDLVVINGSLYIYLHDAQKNLVIWDFKQITSCHFDGIILKMEQTYPKQIIICADQMAREIYRVYTGETSVEKKTKRNANALALIIIFCLGFCVVLWVYVIPWFGEKSASLIPTDLEISLGEKISENLEERNHLNDSATYFANRFTEQLQLDETYPIKIKVIKSEEVNAFALPGGKIFIYTGILEKMDSYEELVALLGHEISHVTNRHSLKSICRSAASGIVLSAFFGDAGGLSSGILSQVNEFKSLDYSRDLETEADNEGLQVMLENKVDPKGMTDLLKLLKEVNAETPGMMKYLSTHPDTDSRIKNISSKPEAKKTFSENEKLQEIFVRLKESL